MGDRLESTDDHSGSSDATSESDSEDISTDVEGGLPGSSLKSAMRDGVLEAFFAMEVRRLRRARQGRVVRKGLASRVANAVQLLVVFVLLVHVLGLDKLRVEMRDRWEVPGIFTAALVISTLVQSVWTPEHTLSAWLSTEVYVWCLWAAWTFDPPPRSYHGPCSGVVLGTLCVDATEVDLFYAFVSVISATCLLYLPHRVILPCIINCGGWRGPMVLCWRGVRPVRTRHGETRFTYRPSGLLSPRRAEFSYFGGLDERGRPHGEGVWTDTSFHGECLRGRWVHGLPSGSFTSREYGTGAQFQQRAVGYATCRGDCMPNSLGSSSFFPFKTDTLRFGIGHVEVSFAGGFFPFLPSVEYHSREETCNDTVDTLLSAMDQLGQEERPVLRLEVLSELEMSAQAELAHSGDSDVRRLEVPVQFLEGEHIGYVHREALISAPSLATRKPEALVFIHGYNCDLATALGRVAQTFALGNMEPHIVPFVFSYSGGNQLSYFGVKCMMHLYGDSLADFLLELGSRFQEIHILTHSCGADFFFKNWRAIEHCFVPAKRTRGARASWDGPLRWVPKGRRLSPDDKRLHLATLTMMNPDVLVETVLELMPSIMQVAEHFTAYNDTNDGALFHSWWLQTVVPRWYQQRVQPPGARTAVFGRTLQSLWVDSADDGLRTLRGDMVNDRADRRSGFACIQRCHSGVAELQRMAVIMGDGSVDIIDCSNIDQNVHSLRHNYYMLNTQMVEDVCELVGKRLTAPYRQRLAHVKANIFNFISPPNFLKEQ